MPALDRALALEQVDHRAVRVAEDLELDVPRPGDQPLDVDHNGTHDVVYYTDDAGLASAVAASNNPGLAKVQVSTDPNAEIIQVHPAGDGTGYYLAWFTNNDSKKVWGEKQYYYPIPVNALNLNPQLEQNPGWENGATNDGN